MSKFTIALITHHMIEHGEYVACGTEFGEDTLDKAIDAAAEEMQRTPGYDGRGEKVVTINDDNGNAHTFYWPGYWGDEATAALRANMQGNMAY